MHTHAKLRDDDFPFSYEMHTNMCAQLKYQYVKHMWKYVGKNQANIDDER